MAPFGQYLVYLAGFQTSKVHGIQAIHALSALTK